MCTSRKKNCLYLTHGRDLYSPLPSPVEIPNLLHTLLFKIPFKTHSLPPAISNPLKGNIGIFYNFAFKFFGLLIQKKRLLLCRSLFLFWSQARVLTYYRLNYCLRFGLQIIDVENTIQFIFRAAELKSLKGRKYLDAWCVYFWATTPVIISILTFTTYALLGNKLTAAKVQIVFLIMFKHVQWNPG